MSFNLEHSKSVNKLFRGVYLSVCRGWRGGGRMNSFGGLGEKIKQKRKGVKEKKGKGENGKKGKGTG